MIGTQGRYENAGTFSEGLAWVRIQGKVGYVDPDVRFVIPPRFDKGADFHEGRCRVLVGASWQYIDKQGVIVAKGGPAVADAWNDAEDFHGGLARVHAGGEFEESHHGPAFWKRGKWCYIDHQGIFVSICRNDEDHLIVPPLGKELDAKEYLGPGPR